MALVNELQKGSKKSGGDKTTVHKATYAIMCNGRLRIDTYGSAGRECPDQPSQTLVFTLDAMDKLRDILKIIPSKMDNS